MSDQTTPPRPQTSAELDRARTEAILNASDARNVSAEDLKFLRKQLELASKEGVFD